jgi:uncharacterized protein YjhX (UPF0386 family)
MASHRVAPSPSKALEVLLQEHRRGDVRARSDRYGAQWLQEHGADLAAAAVAKAKGTDADALRVEVRCYRRDAHQMGTCQLADVFASLDAAPPSAATRAGQIVLAGGQAVSAGIVHAAFAALAAARG